MARKGPAFGEPLFLKLSSADVESDPWVTSDWTAAHLMQVVPTAEFDMISNMDHWTDTHPFWIGERGRRAKELWADGHTFRQIADAIGTTRSAVAGFIRRQRLLLKSSEKPPVKRPKKARSKPKPMKPAKPTVVLPVGARVQHSDHYFKTQGGAMHRGRTGTVTKVWSDRRWVHWDGNGEHQWNVGYLAPAGH